MARTNRKNPKNQQSGAQPSAVATGSNPATNTQSWAKTASSLPGKPQTLDSQPTTSSSHASGPSSNNTLPTSATVDNAIKEDTGGTTSKTNRAPKFPGASTIHEALRTTDEPVPPPAEGHVSTDSKRLNREYVAASLVGRRCICVVRDGARFSGSLGTYGNHLFLPESWRQAQEGVEVSTPDPESAVVYVPGAGAQRGTFGLYHSEERAALSKLPSLWLRDAHRLASSTQPSSGLFDWLAVLWADVAFLQSDPATENMPDIGTPDDGGSYGESEQKSVLSSTCHGLTPFQTDAEIIATRREAGSSRAERRLLKWTDDPREQAPERRASLSHPDTRPSRANVLDWPESGTASIPVPDPGNSSWDQFDTNARMFGVTSTYVEGMYSTQLNEHEIPEDVRRRADKLAEEMGNARRAADGWVENDEACDDEEAKFSAVVGTGAYGGSDSSNPWKSRTSRTQSNASSNQPRPLQGSKQQPSGRQRPLMVDPLLPRRPSVGHRLGAAGPVAATVAGPGMIATQGIVQPPRTKPAPQPSTEPPNLGAGDAANPTQSGALDRGRAYKVKDNINALNLEPTRPTAQAHAKPQVSRAAAAPTAARPAVVGIPAGLRPSGAHCQPHHGMKHHLPYGLPAASYAAIPQGQKLNKKEEFLAGLKEIEANMIKKGWTKPDASDSKTSSPETAPTKVAPPPTSIGDAKISGQRLHTADAHTSRPAVAAGTGAAQQFQFNPNAHSFTPKGAAPTTAVQPTTGDEVRPPPVAVAPAPAVAASNPVVPPQRPAAALRPGLLSTPATIHQTHAVRPNNFELLQPQRAENTLQILAKFREEAHANAVQAVGDNIRNESPDWPNRLAYSYQDVLDYGTRASPPPAVPSPVGIPSAFMPAPHPAQMMVPPQYINATAYGAMNGLAAAEMANYQRYAAVQRAAAQRAHMQFYQHMAGRPVMDPGMVPMPWMDPMFMRAPHFAPHPGTGAPSDQNA